MAILGQQAGDTISTVGLIDPDPQGGSITLYAGWQVDGEPYGAPHKRIFPGPGSAIAGGCQGPAGHLSILVERHCAGSHALTSADGWVHHRGWDRFAVS